MKNGHFFHIAAIALTMVGCNRVDIQYSAKIESKSSQGACGASLTSTQILASSNIQGVKFPNNYAIEGLDLTGRNITGTDFSNAKGFSAEQFNKAQIAAANKFPNGFDFENIELNSNRTISESDLNNVLNLSVEHLQSGRRP